VISGCHRDSAATPITVTATKLKRRHYCSRSIAVDDVPPTGRISELVLRIQATLWQTINRPWRRGDTSWVYPRFLRDLRSVRQTAASVARRGRELADCLYSDRQEYRRIGNNPADDRSLLRRYSIRARRSFLPAPVTGRGVELRHPGHGCSGLTAGTSPRAATTPADRCLAAQVPNSRYLPWHRRPPQIDACGRIEPGPHDGQSVTSIGGTWWQVVLTASYFSRGTTTLMAWSSGQYGFEVRWTTPKRSVSAPGSCRCRRASGRT